MYTLDIEIIFFRIVLFSIYCYSLSTVEHLVQGKTTHRIERRKKNPKKCSLCVYTMRKSKMANSANIPFENLKKHIQSQRGK